MIRIALAAIATCVAAVFTYAALRATQLVFFPEPNPATVIWSAHSGYFWRALIVAYGGGMVGFVAWIIAGRDAERVARVLATAVAIAAVAIAVQAIALP